MAGHCPHIRTPLGYVVFTGVGCLGAPRTRLYVGFQVWVSLKFGRPGDLTRYLLVWAASSRQLIRLRVGFQEWVLKLGWQGDLTMSTPIDKLVFTDVGCQGAPRTPLTVEFQVWVSLRFWWRDLPRSPPFDMLVITGI